MRFHIWQIGLITAKFVAWWRKLELQRAGTRGPTSRLCWMRRAASSTRTETRRPTSTTGTWWRLSSWDWFAVSRCRLTERESLLFASRTWQASCSSWTATRTRNRLFGWRFHFARWRHQCRVQWSTPGARKLPSSRPNITLCTLDNLKYLCSAYCIYLRNLG